MVKWPLLLLALWVTPAYAGTTAYVDSLPATKDCFYRTSVLASFMNASGDSVMEAGFDGYAFSTYSLFPIKTSAVAANIDSVVYYFYNQLTRSSGAFKFIFKLTTGESASEITTAGQWDTAIQDTTLSNVVWNFTSAITGDTWYSKNITTPFLEWMGSYGFASGDNAGLFMQDNGTASAKYFRITTVEDISDNKPGYIKIYWHVTTTAAGNTRIHNNIYRGHYTNSKDGRKY